jgi:Domain of unknown function (DUF5666)
MTRISQQLSRLLGSSILLALLTVLIAGCSVPFLPTSSSTNTSATSATACPTVVPSQAVRGTIQSINGSTIVLTDANGNSVTATYTSTTRFTRQVKASTTALVSGTFVFVAVTQNADNTYTATSITLTNGGNGQRFGGGFGGGSGRRGNSPCRQGQRGNFGGQNFAGMTGNARGITGTVSQLSGKTLTVTDVNQADYTVTLNATTQIIQTSQASASSLQVGMRINVVGMRNAQGVITARSVTILAAGSGKGKGA